MGNWPLSDEGLRALYRASYVTGELVDYLSRDAMAQVEHTLLRYFGLLG